MPLEIARFVDGRLDDEHRARMLMHLSECDDCRELVATVAAASPAGREGADDAHAPARLSPRAWWRRRPGAWAAAAALAAAAVFTFSLTPPPPAAPVDVWAEVATAIGPARTVEARLSRLPAHVPLAPPTRAETAGASFARQALAARLREAAAGPAEESDERRVVRHAAGVAALVAGRAADAVPLLESALVDASSSSSARADVLADLSAAYAELGKATSREHWTMALRAAEEALANDTTHATGRFNRALALEHLQRTDQALSAWRDLAADASLDPGWRKEAVDHARALAR